MAKVNITEAAKLAGITRQYLHKKYLKPKDKDGNPLPPLLTVEQDHQGNPIIDTSEILRVFGELKVEAESGDSEQHDNRLHDVTQQYDIRITGLQAEVQLLREQLQGAQRREEWLQSIVDKQADQILQLEHHRAAPAPVPRRGFFARLFRGGA